MKNALITVLLSITLFTGCKYDEGPFISFRKKKTRLVGRWTLVEFKTNINNLLDSFMAQPTWIFYQQETFAVERNTSMGMEGSWEFSDKKNEIVVDFYDDFWNPVTFNIIQLKYDEMKLHSTRGGIVSDYYFQRIEE